MLRLWVAVRTASRSERICGEETLGMTPQMEDKACSNFGNILLPPVMTAQIQIVLWTTILSPLKRAVLDRLQNLIQANKVESRQKAPTHQVRPTEYGESSQQV